MTLLIPYAGLESSPWKNGAGCTTEIAAAPPGATFDSFDWRISLATISHDGPFSHFPGIDRTLALVDGPGATLDIGNGSRFLLCEEEPIFEFAGEANIAATLAGGPTTDFNVMTRRQRCHHRVGRRVLRGEASFAPRGDVALLFLAEGESLSVSSDAERIGLVRFDTIVFDTSTVWTLESVHAVVLIVDIFFSPA
ncbi:MAG: HutD family protein [Gammaproteobacteria bacterium]